MEVGWCSEHGLPHSHLLEWSDEDRAKLVAYLMESAARCQMCGTSPWEWEEDRLAYGPATEQCQGCYIKDTAAEDDDTPKLKGSRVVLIPRRQFEERARREFELKKRSADV